MRYIIDGYNLIGKIDKISFSHPEKENQLIQFIEARGLKPRDQFLIVFDGKGDLNLHVAKEKKGPFTLLFTPNYQTADDYIAELVQKTKNKTGKVVISSDNEVIRAAKQARVEVQKCEEFLTHFHNQDGPSLDNEKPSRVGEADINFWLDQFS